jgi:hypothetical protein
VAEAGGGGVSERGERGERGRGRGADYERCSDVRRGREGREREGRAMIEAMRE